MKTRERDRWIVVTTINPPTEGIEHISALCREGWSAVVVGDVKTPGDWHAEGVDYLSVDRQREVFGPFADLVPLRHYSRKNLGYLYAMQNGAQLILETDDDNVPSAGFGGDLSVTVRGRLLHGGGWVNVYRQYSDRLVWPRGLPLDSIHVAGELATEVTEHRCLVQQFLADRDPDVDAIYRLLYRDELTFNRLDYAVVMDTDAWCPFNTQNTLIHAAAFPLMYLPCHVSFRMTDIWRSFVIQQGLWIHGETVAFRNATVKQYRNDHNLMRDFSDEVVGYLENRRLGSLLHEAGESMSAAERNSMSATGRALWYALIDDGIVPEQERPIVDAWFARME